MLPLILMTVITEQVHNPGLTLWQKEEVGSG